MISPSMTGWAGGAWRRPGRWWAAMAALLGAALTLAVLATAAGALGTPATVTVESDCAAPTLQDAGCFAETLLPSNLSTAQEDTPVFRSLKAQHRIVTLRRVDDALPGHGPGGGLSPRDLTSAYALPLSPAGSGQTVAVVDAYGDPNIESDLNVYRSHFGLPPCTTANGCFTKVAGNGSTNYPPLPPYSQLGWTYETALDVDMVSAICPSCHILLVQAYSPTLLSLRGGVEMAIALGATEISNSWGFPEAAGDTNDDAGFNVPGLPIVFAAGDNGFTPAYPATSPNVIPSAGRLDAGDEQSRVDRDGVEPLGRRMQPV